jgi:hypothetical protein
MFHSTTGSSPTSNSSVIKNQLTVPPGDAILDVVTKNYSSVIDHYNVSAQLSPSEVTASNLGSLNTDREAIKISSEYCGDNEVLLPGGFT